MSIDLYSALMGAGRYTSSLRYNPSARSSANDGPAQNFGSALSAEKSAAQANSSSSVPCMDLYPEGVTSLENRIFWCASPGQNLFVEYAENSTPEDPIVRIRATSNGKSYDFTRHINDIDPSNASYAEMGALVGHLKQIGEYNESIDNGLAFSPLPMGYEVGNYMQKQNFMAGIRNIASSEMFSQNIVLSAADYLEMYSSFMQSRQEAKQAAEFDALMAAVDRVLEKQDWEKDLDRRV